MNPVELRTMDIKALIKELGPLGMIRFLQQYETGLGDFTKESKQWLGDATVESVVEEIKSSRLAHK
jgi:hypothetical protein